MYDMVMIPVTGKTEINVPQVEPPVAAGTLRRRRWEIRLVRHVPVSLSRCVVIRHSITIPGEI